MNREVKHKEAIHSENWNKFPSDFKRELINVDPEYQYYSIFIYDKHEKLPEYPVNRPIIYEEKIDEVSKLPKFELIKKGQEFKTNHYMINLKKNYHLHCKKITRQDNKVLDDEILSIKILQLTNNVRNELKRKIAF